MAWNNKSEDENLKRLENELSLENIKGSNVITDDDEISSLSDNLGEGQYQQVYTGGSLYLYTKYNGSLYKLAWASA